ncbi:MAG TPA: peptidase [bacterium]|nr:peptidase [bacterium]
MGGGLHILFIFVDGLGVGPADPSVNPCADPALSRLAVYRDAGGLISRDPQAVAVEADAALGVPGLPQSATGQTALFSGVNAPGLLGRHLSGFPNQPLREVLREKSLLKQVKETGLSALFVNAYRDLFFKLSETLQWKLSATTVANLAAGLPFRRIQDIPARRALYHDFTNGALIQKGFDLPEFSPESAGEILAGLSREYALCLFEYFRTDRAGHTQNMEIARAEIRRLDRFLSAILARIDAADTLVLLASDHGNIEDLSVRTHTVHPAMTLAWGRHASVIGEHVRSLTDVAPLLIDLLKADTGAA